MGAVPTNWDWNSLVATPEAKIAVSARPGVVAELSKYGPLSSFAPSNSPNIPKATLQRILELCPCLYAQINLQVTARAVVHLCEVTLRKQIDSANVEAAFGVQHPGTSESFSHPPLMEGAGGGDIMEALCSEVLTNHGVPHMERDATGWPVWSTPAHLSLNGGKMRAAKLYGDILIPAVPHNILISVKSETARERFIVSGNRLESIGFGFFNDPSEFWTTSRMDLLKRWGFAAVYMPASTLAEIKKHLSEVKTESHAININGRPLYRPLSDFGSQIRALAGKLSFAV
jgi:hypothetical protein